jgi:hypothetical protein
VEGIFSKYVITLLLIKHMFWGASIKSGKSITVEAQSTSKDEQDDLLHISNVALAHNAGGGRVYLNV